MGFNAAWHNDFAISVNCPSGLHRGVVDADVGNMFTADADGPTRRTLGGYDLTVPDKQI
jgi:hypothetical protein